MKILGLLLALVMLLQGAPEKLPEPYAVATLNIHGSVDRNGNGNAGKPEAVTRDVVAFPGLGIAGHRIDWALTHDRVALVVAAPGLRSGTPSTSGLRNAQHGPNRARSGTCDSPTLAPSPSRSRTAVASACGSSRTSCCRRWHGDADRA